MHIVPGHQTASVDSLDKHVNFTFDGLVLFRIAMNRMEGEESGWKQSFRKR